MDTPGTITVERTDPPLSGSEAQTLLTFLDYHRRTLLLKADGLDAAGLDQALAPSTMTLGGLLKHLAYVEHHWLHVVLLGLPPVEPWASADWDADPDWEWHSAVDDSPEQLRDLFARSVARSEQVVADALNRGDLGQVSVRPQRGTGEHYSLRWILVHLVEEYARHNGHADLLREAVDGTTGE